MLVHFSWHSLCRLTAPLLLKTSRTLVHTHGNLWTNRRSSIIPSNNFNFSILTILYKFVQIVKIFSNWSLESERKEMHLHRTSYKDLSCTNSKNILKLELRDWKERNALTENILQRFIRTYSLLNKTNYHVITRVPK